MRLENHARQKSKLTKILIGILLLVFVFLSLYPFFYMIIVSFLTDNATMQLTWKYLTTTTWSFDSYNRIFLHNDFLRYFFNSSIVAVLACVGTTAVSSAAAYAFAKKQFPCKNLLYTLFLATMMVPGVVTMVPRFLQMRDMGLLNTHISMALPLMSGAFGTILLRSFIESLPNDLLEAADLDGCGEIKKFFTIVLPLIKPALISLIIFTAISAWSEFLWPTLMASDNNMNVLTTAVAKMKDVENGVEYSLIMAGATVSFLPPIIVYAFLQKQFVEGIALSGTKS